MLELILTRPRERKLIDAAKGLRFLVLDELHTYRGRQGADVALLVRRTRDLCEASSSSTSARRRPSRPAARRTISAGRWRASPACIFGAAVRPEDVIGETLRRATPEADFADPAFAEALHDRLDGTACGRRSDFEAFLKDPRSPLDRERPSALRQRRGRAGSCVPYRARSTGARRSRR